MNLPTWKKLVLLGFVLTTSVSSASGANVALRAKSHHQGSMIRLGDIADISAASTSELNDLGTTVILPAPAPGRQHFLRRAQVRDLLAARGVDLGAIYFSGAEVVEVGIAASKEQLGTSDERLASQPTADEIESSLHASIKQYLSRESRHSRWNVATEIDSAALRRLAQLGFELNVSGGRKPWVGRQYFSITGDQSAQTVTIAANVTKIQPVVALLRTVQRGELIRVSDLEIRQHEGALPNAAVSSLAEAVGMEAKRTIKADTILLESFLSSPLLVERGETVTVFARTAGITVRTFAVARQNGAHGELVQVESLDDKQRFTARVSGRRQLEVLATGATAGDFATLPRHEPLRR